MNTEKERYYDPKEMLKYAFSNIKAIIIVLIVGALLGLGVCVVKKNAVVTQEPQENEAQMEIQNAKEALNEHEISETEETYSAYKSLDNQRKSLQKYIKNSIYLNLNQSTARANTIVFSIDGNSKSKAIESSYIHLIKNNVLFKDINTALKMNVEPTYLSELINITDSNENSDTSSVVVNSENTHENSFIVTIVGKDDAQCKAITQCVKKRINQVTASLKKSFGNYNVSKTADTYEPATSSDITASRRDYNDKLNVVENAIASTKNGLNDNERAYLTALIDNNGGTSSTASAANTTSKGTTLNYSALIKNAVEGAVVLVVLLIIIRIFKYMLDQKIHSEREFTYYFGLDVIADVKENNKIDENVITEEINFISKKNNNEKIGLLSSLDDNSFENTIYQSLKDHNVNCDMIPSAPESKDDFDKLMGVGKAVIFEKIGSSNIHNVEKMLRYYELKNIKVVGAVLIK